MRIETGECKVVMDLATVDRAAWLERRRKGIGGSDAAAILGLSPWRSALGTAVDKKGLGAATDEDDDNDVLRFGRRMEEPILKWFAEDFEREEGMPIVVHRTPYMYASVARPWQIGDIDGLMVTDDGVGGIEVKTHDRYALKAYGTDAVPDWVEPQVQHYMAVTGLTWFYVVALIGRKLLWRRVERDKAAIEHIINEEEHFYRKYMLTDALPPPAGLDSDDDIIRALYGLSDSQDEVVLAEDSLLAQEYTEAVGAEKAAAETKARCRQTIQLHMGTAKYATCGGYRATWTRFQQKRLDLDLLRQEQPEIAERYTRTAPATRFVVKEVGE